MVAETAVRNNSPPLLPASPGAMPPDGRWELLGRLEVGAIGNRRAGAVVVRRSAQAGCFLYGPYVHLPAGWYRLGFLCRAGAGFLPKHPVLGVEVIVLARFQVAWADFTGAELATAGASLVFEVSAEHAIDGGNEGRFEFRFSHLGNADLAIAAVSLERLAAPPAALPPRRWRMLGRLQTTWRTRRAAGGAIHVARFMPPGCVAYGGWPYLRLPRGACRLVVEATAATPRRGGAPALGVEIIGRSRWRSGMLPGRRRPRTGAVSIARREASADEVAAGPVVLEFSVPAELALEAGADAPFEIRLIHLGGAALRIERVDVERAGCREVPLRAVSAAPRLAAGRRKIVMIGNCQMETLRLGFSHIEALSRRYDVKYHFVQLPPNLHEFAARDLEACDVVIAQDIRLWNEFPLRDAIRPGADIVRAPLVRFASLWPFDGWNGPTDRDAFAREAPNLTFPYLDGLLGRLRKEIPDRDARFEAYRSLEILRLVNYRRLHQLEEQRLAAMDREFGVAIGAYILENFRRRRILHTTVRPNWQVFGLLLQHIADLVGAGVTIRLPRSIDGSLRNPQVPVHPRIAAALGVKWADGHTRYLDHGRKITWETYIRSYIEHYG